MSARSERIRAAKKNRKVSTNSQITTDKSIMPELPAQSGILLSAQPVASAASSSADLLVPRMTTYEYLMFWLKNYKYGLVKTSTYDTLERIVLSYIKDYIGDIPLVQLSSEHIQGHLLRLKEAEGYSYSTVKKVYHAFTASLGYAFKRKWIPTNPMDFVEMPAEALFEASEISYFSVRECSLIIEEATKEYSTGRPVYLYGDAVILILLTGIRLGEAIGLHKSDYIRERKVLRIQRNVTKARNRDKNGNLLPGRILKETSTKSYSGYREIPLTSQAVNAVERMISAYPYSEYIINSSKGKMATPEQVDRTFRYLLRNVGLEVSGVHKLRHTFASLLFASNKTDVKTISRLLGHASVTITLVVYIHIAERISHEAVTPLDELF